MPEDRRLAAIMFTDIVGYTRLMGSDEEKAVDMLFRNRSIHQTCIEKFNGTLIKEIGDGILASFSLASEAVRCAIEIQKECKTEGIPLKIGIHEGEMIFSGSDVIGDGVNIASRLQEDTQDGCINISAAVYGSIRNKANIQTRFIGEKSYKNVGEPIRVYGVILKGQKAGQHHERAIVKRPGRSLAYFILAGLIFVLLAFLIIWKLRPHLEKVELDKSIAILPLEYLSEDPGKKYLADGVLDAITGHLSKIKGLRVTPRTSIEQYRETTKTASTIGKELEVSYLIEGSFLMVQDQVVLTIQLIIAQDEDHVFFKEYKRDYNDIIAVQSEVAQTIAREIEVIITPNEKELIEKIPTKNLTAYDLYLKAKSESDIDKAIILYNLVLDFDSTFAQAYTGLAQCYNQKHFWDTYFKEDFLDSSLILANIALSYDDQLDEVYLIKGKYFQEKGMFSDALKNYEKAVDINPNNADVWFAMAVLYGTNEDYLNAGICAKNAYDIDIKKYQYTIINMSSTAFSHLGLFEESKDYLRELFRLEAEEYFKTQMYHCKESIRLKRPYGLRDAYFDLAGIYAFKGDKELAYENLDKFASANFFSILLINLINNDPMFNTIRNEPRFQRIVGRMKLKNLEERKRVQSWVAENKLF